MKHSILSTTLLAVLYLAGCEPRRERRTHHASGCARAASTAARSINQP